jgi:hypothetical protein
MMIPYLHVFTTYIFVILGMIHDYLWHWVYHRWSQASQVGKILNPHGSPAGSPGTRLCCARKLYSCISSQRDWDSLDVPGTPRCRTWVCCDSTWMTSPRQYHTMTVMIGLINKGDIVWLSIIGYIISDQGVNYQVIINRFDNIISDLNPGCKLWLLGDGKWLKWLMIWRKRWPGIPLLVGYGPAWTAFPRPLV